jgi:hypothetical protein
MNRSLAIHEGLCAVSDMKVILGHLTSCSMYGSSLSIVDK